MKTFDIYGFGKLLKTVNSDTASKALQQLPRYNRKWRIKKQKYVRPPYVNRWVVKEELGHGKSVFYNETGIIILERPAL